MKWFPPRKRTKIYVIALVAGVLLSVVVWWSLQPSYHGKSLEWWLEQANQGTWDDRSLDASSESVTQAVLHVGQRAVPTLLKMLKDEHPRWKGKLEAWTGSVERLPTIHFQDRSRIVNNAAIIGFAILKKKADNALPELRSMLHDTNTCQRAAEALRAIGPQTIPLLLEGTTNNEPAIRSWSAYALASFETSAPMLSERMWALRQDTNEMVASYAWSWLFLHETQNVDIAREALRDGRRFPVGIA